MKRRTIATMVLTLALVMALLLSGCSGKKADDLSGTWKLVAANGGQEINLEEYGLNMSLTLNADGTAKIVIEGEEDSNGTWKKEDNGVSLTGPDGDAVSLVLEDGKLIWDDQGTIMSFAKEK